MRRIVTISVLAAGLLAGPVGSASAAGPLVEPGGQCNGVVDTGCREHVCQPDELDCGLIPPCLLWVAGHCLIG